VNARTAGVCAWLGGEVVPGLYPAFFSVGGILLCFAKISAKAALSAKMGASGVNFPA
jgi:hypothetical protein